MALSSAAPFAEILQRRYGRRAILRGLAAAVAASAPTGLLAAPGPSSLAFTEVAHGSDDTLHVAAGYGARVLLRWGDAVLPGAPSFDPRNQSAAAQAMQFGYNCDFVCFMPLPRGSRASDRGLLCVNHEFTNATMMFPGVTRHNAATVMTRALAEVEMAAQGHSVVEIERAGGVWRPVAGSAYNRRITALATPMRLAGPAAGHPRLATSADPDATTVVGTMANCAGGVTPWGTVLIAEENFNGYFAGEAGEAAETVNHARYGLGGGTYYPWWGRHHARFDLAREPREPNRFGWVVEYDPYDPESVPVKRTALGRFKHEAATTALTADGRVAVYSGDDEAFEYLYRFVSRDRFNAGDRAANRELLDHGTLAVARFEADGGLVWLPLVFGEGPLTPANGFAGQADVVIEARRAGDLVGATPLDRPEDVETNPVTGRVYVMLTNNARRLPGQTDAVNPRPINRFGQIVELVPPADGGHGADSYRWEMLLLCGDPRNPLHGADYHPEVSSDGWLADPDNCAFDGLGRLWIATDGAPKTAGFADGIYACDTVGPGRALTRQFLRGPLGAEICGPWFTPDDTTLFAAIQHPAAGKGSTFDSPSTRWPDFDPALPPRPSVVAVTRDGGGRIGS